MNRVQLLLTALLATFPLYASCTPFAKGLQTRSEDSSINFSPSGGASYLYGNPDGLLDTSSVISKQTSWYPQALYDATCKETLNAQSLTCKPSGTLGASMDIPSLRSPSLPMLPISVTSVTNAIMFDNYGNGVVSDTSLERSEYQSVGSGWYPNVHIPFGITALLAVNTLSTPSSVSTLTFGSKDGNGYDVNIATCHLGNHTTSSFDTLLKALHVTTMTVGMKNRFEAAATDAIHIGTLSLGVESSLSLKAPTLSIATLNESASSNPNTISITADTLDIGALNLADNTRLSIAPYSAETTTVTIGTMKTGSKARLTLAAGVYHIGAWTTSGGSLQAALVPQGRVRIVFGSNLTINSANLLNADASGDICSDSHSADDLTLLVHGDVTFKANNRASAILYATGDVTLESGVAFKGAISAQNAVNLHQGVKVCYAGCAGASPTQPQATLTSLSIKLDRHELAEGSTTGLHVTAFYDDNSSKDVTTEARVQIGVPEVLRLDANATVTALQEGKTAIYASFEHMNTASAAIVTIYKEKDGHRLPPMPDEKLNNSTLLGIDTNNNGVRDDVERWIYTRYNEYYPCDLGFYKIITDGKERYYTGEHILPEGISVLELINDSGRHVVNKEDCAKTPTPYHRIVREIAMQGAKAAQIIIQEPEKARETRKYFADAYLCASYFRTGADSHNEPILIDHYLFGDEFKAKQFNTVKRVRAFGKYNAALSGGVYQLPTDLEIRAGCDFNITELLEAGK